MSFTLSTFGANQTISGTTNQVTLTIPPGAAVGITVNMHGSSGASYLTGSVADTGSNTYTSAGGAAFTSNGGINYNYTDAFYCLNTGSSATSVTYTMPYVAANIDSCLVAVWVWTVAGGTATFGSQSSNGQNAPGTGADAITSGSVTCATGSVIMGFNRDLGSGTVSVGTGFTSDYSAFGEYTAEHGAFSASQAATFTTTVGADNPVMSQAISFGLGSPDTLPCGTTASGATVATGTGGLALPAFAVGDCIVVLTMAQTASALTETFNGDGSNAYTHLQVADNHSTEGFILSRYATIVTTPLASPVLQSTFSGSATKLGIAAVKVGSISPGSPFVPGGNAQHLQTTPSGTNSQVSGLTTSANTNIPVTLVAWGLSVNFAGAPTAGSGFTPQGTAWSAFGAPCLTCETQTSSSLIQQQATFTPIGGTDTYTFLDVFNQLSVAFQIIMGQACL